MKRKKAEEAALAQGLEPPPRKQQKVWRNCHNPSS